MKNVLAWSIAFNFVQFCLMTALWESRNTWIHYWRQAMKDRVIRKAYESQPAEKK